MERFFDRVVRNRKRILIVFAAVLVVCFICKSFISVNYDMNSYLPDDAASTVALNVMKEEFNGGIPNARVMIKNISVTQALEYKKQLEAVDGVTSVGWLDDSIDMAEPIETADQSIVETYYKDGNALYSITIDDNHILSATSDIRKIIGDDNCMTGAAANTAAATNSTVSEISRIVIISIIFVLFILFLTTTSWAEPVIVMIGLGVAIVLNAGSNIIFGEISFVTNAAGNILQLAVSLDYSVFLIHRFEESGKMISDSKAAMKDALAKSFSSILSSGITTVIGFLALCLMRFKIGPDLGLALAKGIAISLLTVFLFMPGLILISYPLMEKTRHKSFMPSFKKFGRVVNRITIWVAVLFIVLAVPSYLASQNNAYYYGASHIFAEGTQLGDDTAEVEAVFGKCDTYVLLVPKGDTAKEYSLVKDCKKFSQVTSVIAFVEQVGPEIPYEYLDAATISKLESEHYSRIILSVAVDYEGEETCTLIENIQSLAQKYYPDLWYMAGEGVSTYDLKNTVQQDMVKVNLLAIGAVFLVLLIMMKNIALPIVLVLTIENAIWINLSLYYYNDLSLFYIAYLIISSVQLGATVDYAILMTERYRENRAIYEKTECAAKTVSDVMVSIITSGSALIMVGFLLGLFSSHQLLSQLGFLIGGGAIVSLIAVVFVLPGLLKMFEGFYNKKRFGKNPISQKPKARRNNNFEEK